MRSGGRSFPEGHYVSKQMHFWGQKALDHAVDRQLCYKLIHGEDPQYCKFKAQNENDVVVPYAACLCTVEFWRMPANLSVDFEFDPPSSLNRCICWLSKNKCPPESACRVRNKSNKESLVAGVYYRPPDQVGPVDEAFFLQLQETSLSQALILPGGLQPPWHLLKK